LRFDRALNHAPAVPARKSTGNRRTARKFLRDNALTLASLLLFGAFLSAQSVTGWSVYNDDQEEHGQQAVGFVEYLGSGHFIEATFENWESEFLQMGMYVLLTAFLIQRGSAESKDPDKQESVDEDPKKHRGDRDAPAPVKAGGLPLLLYENSLFLAFVALFLLSFSLHAIGGATVFSQEQLAHGGEPVTAFQYLGTSQFWFESFQNWQSEFLAVAAIVLLSVFLRQKGSSESKPVHAPHSQTGEA
jgi:hypothetical protein